MLSVNQAKRILKTRPFYRNVQPSSPWDSFLEHFQRNESVQESQKEITLPELESAQRDHLLRSLEIFRRGETGEGRILNQIELLSYYPVDQEYRKSLRLFVAEEGRHARILGQIIKQLQGEGDPSPLTQINSSESENSISYRLFYRARGLMGVRLKLMVLLCAEIIGCESYEILSRALGNSKAGERLMEIRQDEEMHLRFHCQFFHLLGVRPIFRKLWNMLYLPIALLACFTVILEHRKTFKIFDVPLRDVGSQFWKRILTGMQWIKDGIPMEEAK